MPSWPYNYHAHTTYGDGRSTAPEQVQAAIERGMRCLGLSEHAPLGADVKWTLTQGQLSHYRNELEALQKLAGDRLELYRGLEFDWRPARDEWYERNEPSSWDYRIGSVHFVDGGAEQWAIDSSSTGFEEGVRKLFRSDIREACAAFYELECQAALAGRFDVLAHADLVKKFNGHGRYFDPAESWYRELALTVVDAARQADIIVEVNTAGLDKDAQEFYPAPWIVERCVQKGVRLTLSGDSHHTSELQRHFDKVIADLQSLGVDELWVLQGGRWQPVSLRQN